MRSSASLNEAVSAQLGFDLPRHPADLPISRKTSGNASGNHGNLLACLLFHNNLGGMAGLPDTTRLNAAN